MKKILVILLLLLGISVNAEIPPINFNLPEDAELDKQLEFIQPMLKEAELKKSEDLYIEAAIKAYNTKKKGNAENIKKYNDVFSASIIGYCMQRYTITQDKKYFKLAHKWSKIAINDRTEQVYAIKAGILIAASQLDKKTVIQGYDLLRCVDEKEANKYYKEYQELITQLDQAIAYHKELRNQRIRTGLQALCNGMEAAGTSMQRSAPSTTTFTTTRVGDTMYTNAYSY